MKTLSHLDTALFALLTLFLLAVITVLGMANPQTGAKQKILCLNYMLFLGPAHWAVGLPRH